MKTKLSDELDSWEYKVKVRMRNDIKSIQWMWSNSCKIEGGRCHISKNVMTQQCQLNHWNGRVIICFPNIMYYK